MIEPASALFYGWLEAFRPSDRLAPSIWAERNLILPASSNAEPGPLRLASYQAQMIDQIADPNVRAAALMIASQVGKSLAIDVSMTHAMACDPGAMLHVSPTEARAFDFVRDRLDPLIAASPALRSIIGGGRKGGGDSKSHKMFPGGSFNVASSFKADGLAARAIRYLYLDEIDRFAESAGKEGDPILLAMKRTHTFAATRKVVIASTPTTSSSRIAQWFVRGDERRFYVACPECGTCDYLRLVNLKWTAGKPQSARLKCEHCAHDMSDRERLDAIDGGEWLPTSEGEPGIISFHANVLISKFASLERIAQDAEDAERTPEKKRVFTNTSAAEPYIADDGEPLDPEALQGRAEPVPKPLPADVVSIVAGVDVQGDRLECTVMANHARGNIATVLNHVVLRGDTTGPAPWALLDQTLGQTFTTVDRRVLPIGMTAIDAQYSTDAVAEFCVAQRDKSRSCFPTKSMNGFDRPFVARSKNWLRNKVSLYLTGVDVLKSHVTARLRMAERGPGWIALPDHLDASYFAGLASEKLVERHVRGAPRPQWERTLRQNEPFDCLILCVVAATRLSRTSLPGAKPAPSVADAAERLHKASNSGAR